MTFIGALSTTTFVAAGFSVFGGLLAVCPTFVTAGAPPEAFGTYWRNAAIVHFPFCFLYSPLGETLIEDIVKSMGFLFFGLGILCIAPVLYWFFASAMFWATIANPICKLAFDYLSTPRPDR